MARKEFIEFVTRQLWRDILELQISKSNFHKYSVKPPDNGCLTEKAGLSILWADRMIKKDCYRLITQEDIMNMYSSLVWRFYYCPWPTIIRYQLHNTVRILTTIKMSTQPPTLQHKQQHQQYLQQHQQYQQHLQYQQHRQYWQH